MLVMDMEFLYVTLLLSLFFFEMSNETTIAIYEIAIVSKIISAIYQRTVTVSEKSRTMFMIQ